MKGTCFVLSSIILMNAYTLVAEELRIGGLYSLTGPGAAIGESSRLGATIAVQVINKTNFLGANTLRIQIEDSQSQGAAGISAFRKLVVSEGVPAILMNLTSVGFAVRDIADQNKIPTFVDSIHTKLSENHKYIFRNFFSNNTANDVVQKLMQEKELRRLAVLHAEEEIGQEALAGLTAKSKSGAFQIVAHESFAKTATDVKVQLLRIKQSNPDIIYIVGFGPAVATAYTQAKQLKIGALFIGSAVCGQPDVLTSAKGALEGTYSSSVKVDEKSERYRHLREEYSRLAAGRVLDQNVIASYDNTWILAEVLKSGSRGGEEIRKSILQRRRFYGSTGEIEFSDSGDSNREMISMTIHNGECVAVR